MDGLKGLGIGLLATALVIGMVPGLVVARPGFNLGDWDAVLSYKVDSDGNVTYTENGAYEKYIDCTADGWTQVLNSTSDGPENKEIHEYAFDYLLGKFGYIHIKDGIKTERHSVCSDFDLEPLPSTSTHWLTECVGSCAGGKTLAGDTGSSLLDPCLCDGFTIEGDDSQESYTTWAATPLNPDWAPFTGVINLDAGANEEGVYDEDGESVLWIRDWVVIGGLTWNVRKGTGPGSCTELSCSWTAWTVAGGKILGVFTHGSIGGCSYNVQAVD